MKISIGITTYNRSAYLKRMSASLMQTKGVENCNIRIYDDCSTEYDTNFLKKLFDGKLAEIISRKKNLGADGNMRQMFADFLQTNDDLLFIADADLIFNPDCFEFINDNFQYTDGILNLYNSHYHRPVSSCIINNNEFHLKSSFGAAGVVLHRERIGQIMKNVPPSFSFDWDWSMFLIRQQVRLLCVKNSLVQHIGSSGQNSDEVFIDFGLNFFPGNHYNEKILIEFFQLALMEKERVIRNSLSLKLFAKKAKTLMRILRRKFLE